MKWRVLWHQYLSQENALSVSWPNQPCPAGSSFPSRKARLSHNVSWCWLVLAESPDSSRLGREAQLLSPRWCISHRNARVSWQRGLCCGISAGCWGRRWLRWDAAGSAATRVPVWRADHSQPLAPKGRAVLVTMRHNAAFNSEKHLGEGSVKSQHCSVHRACCPFQLALASYKILSKSDFVFPPQKSGVRLCVLAEGWTFPAFLNIWKVFEIRCGNYSKIFLFYLC